jgi:hypothetical protein
MPCLPVPLCLIGVLTLPQEQLGPVVSPVCLASQCDLGSLTSPVNQPAFLRWPAQSDRTATHTARYITRALRWAASSGLSPPFGGLRFTPSSYPELDPTLSVTAVPRPRWEGGGRGSAGPLRHPPLSWCVWFRLDGSKPWCTRSLFRRLSCLVSYLPDSVTGLFLNVARSRTPECSTFLFIETLGMGIGSHLHLWRLSPPLQRC